MELTKEQWKMLLDTWSNLTFKGDVLEDAYEIKQYLKSKNQGE